MRKSLLILLVALIALSPIAAYAEVTLGAIFQGPWSSWSENVPKQAHDRVIETRESMRRVARDVYTYRRYEYFNINAGKIYVTCTEAPGDMMKPGSGRWVERTFPVKLKQVGIVDMERCYEGQWFFEEKGREDMGDQLVTEYRYRTEKTIQCIFDEHDAAIARGESYQLKYQLLDGTNLTFKSESPSIASVDEDGLVRALDVGACEIHAFANGKKVETLSLNVGERITGFPAGVHTIQLIGSDEFIATAGGQAKQGAMGIVSNSIPEQKRFFHFVGAKRNAFRIKIDAPEVLYLSVRKKDSKARLTLRASEEQQLFSVLRLKGGQDLIHLTADPTKFLVVDERGELSMRPFEEISTKIRWKIYRGVDNKITSGGWGLPYLQDGSCYTSQNYVGGIHNGIDIGSHGRRVPALSVASGVVVEAYTGCEHDYGKPTNKHGKQVDPCGDRSFGQIVIVRHENGMLTAYAHLSRVAVKVGDRVSQGDVLGITGSTGSSTAVHLHLEVRDAAGNTYDPRRFIDFPGVQ